MDHPQAGTFPTEAERGVRIIGGRRYVTIGRLAQLIGRTTRTVQRWHEQRIGPPRVEILGLILYDESKLPAWLERHEKQPVRRRPRTATPAPSSPPDTSPTPLHAGRRE